jgi:hypothetical protein
MSKDTLEGGTRIYLECRIEDLERRVAEMEARDSAVGVAPVEAALRTHLGNVEEQVELVKTANMLLRKEVEELRATKAAEAETLQKKVAALREENKIATEALRAALTRMESWRDKYAAERRQARKIHNHLNELTQKWSHAEEPMVEAAYDILDMLPMFGDLWEVDP